ncbi:MAG: hypothetical protein U9R01_06550 [candidate division WOR-3 bacterium]|nr:hypothetical protein [candidate division WOR-3 bacterium]
MRVNIFCWVMIVPFVLSASSITEKMTAEKVIQNCMASYEKQMKGVKDITIVTDRDITYQKWTTIEGKTICKTRCEMEITGKKFVTIYDGVYQWEQNPVLGKVTKEKIDYNPYQTIENLKTTPAQYVGTEQIDGHKTYILDIKDITKLMGSAKPEGMEKVRISGKLWVDAKDWVIRKMEMDIEGVDEKGKKRTIKTTTEMKDFRKVNGLFIPYRTVMTMDGGISKLSPEQEQEMHEGLAEMQKQLEEMPPEQRKMAEKMMKPQMEMMQKALGGGGEVTEVKKVTINTGLSDNLFDGSKLKQ